MVIMNANYDHDHDSDEDVFIKCQPNVEKQNNTTTKKNTNVM